MSVRNHRQIHPGHHAPGRRRRRRRPAHQPALLDVLPQDHRRPGPGAGAAAATATARRSRSALQWRTWAADPEGITGDELLDLRQRRALPGAQGAARRRQAGRPPPRRARRLRGRLQLHEVRPAHAPGDQQDQRRSTSTTWPSASTSATSTSRSSTTCRAPATRASTTPRAPSPPSWSTASTRKPGEILLDPACGTGGFLTCALRHMRKRYVKKVEDEQRDAAGPARRGEEAAPAHAVRHQHAAARHRGPELRAPRQHAGPALHQLRRKRPRRHRRSPIRPSAGARKTASRPTSPSTSRRGRRPTCSWPSSSAC